VDFASYAVARSIVFMPCLRNLKIVSTWEQISHGDSLYKKLDDEFNSFVSSTSPKIEGIQSLMAAGVKNANTFLAWLLLSSLNKCQTLMVFQISPAYFIHDDDAFRIFLEILPKNHSICALDLFDEEEQQEEAVKWYHDDRCREKVEKLALQCLLGCPRQLYTFTNIPNHVADPNDYRRITNELERFNRKGRSVIEQSSSKKDAVEVLVMFRNELCCLHIALLMNPALFFSM